MKKFVVVAILFLLTAVFYFVIYSGFDKKEIPVQIEKKETLIKTEKKYTPSIRMELVTPLQKEKQLDLSSSKIKFRALKSKKNEAYLIKTKKKNVTVDFKVLANGPLTLKLFGYQEIKGNREKIEHWVTYNSVKLNGKELLKKQKKVGYKKPLKIKLTPQKDSLNKLEISWTVKDRMRSLINK